MIELFTEKEYLKAISKANKGDVIFFNECKGRGKSLWSLELANELEKKLGIRQSFFNSKFDVLLNIPQELDDIRDLNILFSKGIISFEFLRRLAHLLKYDVKLSATNPKRVLIKSFKDIFEDLKNEKKNEKTY